MEKPYIEELLGMRDLDASAGFKMGYTVGFDHDGVFLSARRRLENLIHSNVK